MSSCVNKYQELTFDEPGLVLRGTVVFPLAAHPYRHGRGCAAGSRLVLRVAGRTGPLIRCYFWHLAGLGPRMTTASRCPRWFQLFLRCLPSLAWPRGPGASCPSDGTIRARGPSDPERSRPSSGRPRADGAPETRLPKRCVARTLRALGLLRALRRHGGCGLRQAGLAEAGCLARPALHTVPPASGLRTSSPLIVPWPRGGDGRGGSRTPFFGLPGRGRRALFLDKTGSTSF